MESVVPSFVEYKIFSTLAPLPNSHHWMMDLCSECLRLLQEFITPYVWHLEPFNLRVNSNGHLYGKTHIGDNVNDEWFIISLLKHLTAQIPHLIIRVLDEDGEIILIEAADHLPPWAQEPDLAEKRVYLYQNHVHLIPLADRPSTLTSLPSGVPCEEDAVKVILAFSHATLATEAVQKCIEQRLGTLPRDWSSESHFCHLYVPKEIAHILETNPQLISPAIQKVHQRDSTGTKACQKMDRFSQPKCVKIGQLLSKCLFAMVSGIKLYPYKKSGWTLPDMDDPSYKEVHLGYVVTAGFELMFQDLKQKSSQSHEPVAEFEGFKKSLEKVGFFRHLLPQSKDYRQLEDVAWSFYSHHSCDNAMESLHEPYLQSFQKALDSYDPNTISQMWKESLKRPADDEAWLQINRADLDDLLATRFLKQGANQSEVLENFLGQSSDMKGVEHGHPPHKPEMDSIHFDADALEAAFQRVLSDESHEDEEDEGEIEEEMNDYYDALCDQLKESKVNPEELDLSVMKNLLSSIENQESMMGPTSTLLNSLLSGNPT